MNMAGRLRFGIGFPNRGILFGSTTVAEMYEMARIADGADVLDSFWVGDSLLSKPRVEAVTTLAALAAVTRRLRLGPACFASFPLRDKITLAIQWASLDVLAGGRTVLVTCLGAGEGWSGDWATEFKAFGATKDERVGRLVEGIEVLRRLWSEPRVTHAGRYIRFEDVEVLPKPLQNPYPIWIANNVRGDSDSDRVQKALRRVARVADGWQTAVIHPAELARRLARLRAFLVEEGKDPSRFETSMYYNVNLNPDRAAAREESLAFLRKYYLIQDYPEAAFDAWSAWGSPEAVIERLEAYVEAGLETFIIRFPSWSMRAQLDAFMEKVLPRFQSRLAPARRHV
jgi:alkanesulfonate monooxygenase SsuD/methylene tetrahydromethanopterin reductase-like flavin-dependent oxidoreductase (luciferase family)